MEEYACKKLIISSFASVYGQQSHLPIGERAPLSPTNPYARSKQMLEQIAEDLCQADEDWQVTILRYFNPVAAHPSGELGENNPKVSNLFPRLLDVIQGKSAYLEVYGNTYDTLDGTGVRDYLHVDDLARGHLAALRQLDFNKGIEIYNLGSGKGYSVLEVIEAMSQVIGREIPYKILPKRLGDPSASYADPSKASKDLGWQASYSLQEMCQHAWQAFIKNPPTSDK